MLKKGETIFDKIGIKYDDLRKMDNPILPIAKYYRANLKPGESLWWANDDDDKSAVPVAMCMWKNILPKEKQKYISYGCVNFPEVFGGKYDNYSLWLGSQGIINSNVRDSFSSGGQEEFLISNGKKVKVPAIYRRIKDNKEFIVYFITHKYFDYVVSEYSYKINQDDISKIKSWIYEVSNISGVDNKISSEILEQILLK